MIDSVLSIVVAAGSVGAAISGVFAAWHGWRNGQAIQEIHVSINSRLTQLLAASRDASFAAGRLEGQVVPSEITAAAAAILLDEAAKRAAAVLAAADKK
jgi:hypothetical protein